MKNILTFETPEGKKDFYVMKIFNLKGRRYIALMPLFDDKTGFYFCRYESEPENERARIYSVPTKDERIEVEKYFSLLMSDKA